MRLTTAVANISLLTLSAFQVDAFQTHRRAFLSPSRKTALRPCQSEKISRIDRSLVAMPMSSSDEDEKSIEELYRIAMEEDEEWYNEFVRDVLGEENVTNTSSMKESKGGDMKSVDTNPVPDPPKWKVREEEEKEKGGNPKEAVEEIASSSKLRDTKENEEETKAAAPKSSKVQENPEHKEDVDAESQEEPASKVLENPDNKEDVDAEAQEEPASENSQAGTSSAPGQTESKTETKTTLEDDVLVHTLICMIMCSECHYLFSPT